MKTSKQGLSGVEGFLFLGKNIGIKRAKKDFGVLYSEKSCNSAAVYTKNQIKGAPLYVNMEHLKNGKAQCVIANSGVSNVATGEEGVKNAEKTAMLAARELGVKKEDVLIASTGVIGRQLPMEKIEKGISGIKNELAKNGGFAEAILTTDTFKKEICVEGRGFKIAGCAKGAGMICPNMATMLAFIITDAEVSSNDLQKMLTASVDKSFNMVNVDMDTSTSDMAIILANGAAGKADKKEFQEALDFVCVELAKMIARDGEGATKLIISEVINSKSEEDARKIAKSIVNSNLLKCAVYGNDPNWGRIMCAIGNSNAEKIAEDRISIWVNDELIVAGGKAAESFDAEKLSKVLGKSREITIKTDMGVGTKKATAFGCDMTEKYVKINSEYTT